MLPPKAGVGGEISTRRGEISFVSNASVLQGHTDATIDPGRPNRPGHPSRPLILPLVPVADRAP
jgi:hypothetical protein